MQYLHIPENRINKFDSDFRYLSNFWPCNILYDNLQFESVEAAYQAAKTLDKDARWKFQSMKAGEAKSWGKTLTLRSDWHIMKLSIMEALVRQKFTTRLDLMRKLLSTGDAHLLEGNTWHDNYWGKCFCAHCLAGTGFANHLGVILMDVRKDLKPFEMIFDHVIGIH